MVLKNIILHAKGKYQEREDQQPEPWGFGTLLKFQKKMGRAIRTRKDIIRRAWWCYNWQCVVTDTNMNEEVVEATMQIIELVGENSESEEEVDSEAAEEVDSEAEEEVKSRGRVEEIENRTARARSKSDLSNTDTIQSRPII